MLDQFLSLRGQFSNCNIIKAMIRDIGLGKNMTTHLDDEHCVYTVNH